MLPRTPFLLVVTLLLLPTGCAEHRDNSGRDKDQASRRTEKDKALTGRARSEVLEDLKNTDAKVRLNALRVLLSHVPTKEDVPALRGALEDPEPLVAEQAAKGLGWVGPDAGTAVPTLIKRLKDPPSEEFRGAAVTALGGIGPKAEAAVPLLVELIRQQEAPVKTRQAAVSALGKMGPVAKAAVPTLIEALADRELEQPAVAALIQMGQEARPAVPALSKRLQPEHPYWLDLVRFLADIDPPVAKAAIPDLRSLASSEPDRDRGIVNFRASQRRIEEARRLLDKLESRDNK
jgi:HEAT repeat protein